MNELGASHFLGPAKVAELAADLRDVAACVKTTILGYWCAERCFAMTVEVVEGVPTYWRVEGPMTKELARIWLNAMTTPASELETSNRRVLN